MTKPPMDVNISFRVRRDLRDAAKAKAIKHQENVSDVLREALERYVKVTGRLRAVEATLERYRARQSEAAQEAQRMRKRYEAEFKAKCEAEAALAEARQREERVRRLVALLRSDLDDDRYDGGHARAAEAMVLDLNRALDGDL